MQLLQTIARYCFRGLAAIGLVVVSVQLLPVDEWWLRAISGPWGDPKGDIMLVLGAESLADTIGVTSYWRCVYAARVWREGGFRRIVISGGTSNGGAKVSEQMRDFLLCQGIPREVMTIETNSMDTHQNALFVKELLAGDSGRKVLLTSDSHILRAFRTFRKAGLDVQPRPFPDGLKRLSRWNQRWSVFMDLSSEALKLGYYIVRGWA